MGMKRTLIALFAAAAIAVPALAQQQDPNQNTNQNTDQKADQKPGQNPDQNAGGGQDTAQNSGASDHRGGRHAMTPTRSQVRMLQLGLNKGGFDAGPVDGVMGPKTQQALQKFQQQHGLQAKGQLDSKTVAALRSAAAQAMAKQGAARRSRTASSRRAHGGMHHR